MTIKKSLLLGSAAALAAAPLAQAADLPVAGPVDYVRVCDAFGTGYHYIPGTETCLKFSGRMRAEIGIQDDNDVDTNDTTFMNSNFELVVNASSQTEVGMLVGQFAISASNEGGVSLGDAWVTIGENILVGRETSRFDFGGGYGMYDCIYCDEALNQFTFIMPFGDGVSFTLGLEDNRDRRVTIAQINGTTNGPTATVTVTGPGPTTFINIVTDFRTTAPYGGMEIPDIVASLRISQGWGSAQISAAAHQIRAVGVIVDPGALPTINDNVVIDPSAEDTAWGFAVQAGAEFNVGAMTSLKLVGGFADGALHYVGGGSLGISEALFDSATGEIEETYEGWYILGGIQQEVSDKLTLGLTGAYHDFDDASVDAWFVGATATYNVVENLDLSLGGMYQEVETSGVEDDDWQVKLRVNRSF